jgi:hypothetical protein
MPISRERNFGFLGKNCELPGDWVLKFVGVILGYCANAYLCFNLGLGNGFVMEKCEVCL